MSTMNPLNPYGGNTPQIDQLIGAAYDNVRKVAQNIDSIKAVSLNKENIDKAALINDSVLTLEEEMIQAVEVTTTKAQEATDSSVIASAKANETVLNAQKAKVARDEAVQASTAANSLVGSVSKAVLSYPNYTSAFAAAATLPDGQSVEVAKDETLQDDRVLYKVLAGSLVFFANLDQLKNDLRDTSKGITLNGAIVGYYADYTKPPTLADALSRNYPVGTVFVTKDAGTKFVVSSSVPDSASTFYSSLGAGKYAVAVDLYPQNNLGNIGTFKTASSVVLADYDIVQNSIYDNASQRVVFTHAKKVGENEIGALSVHGFDGIAIGAEIFNIKGVPAGHFSYTALQRKGADLWLWFQHYTSNASGPRGIGRIKVAAGAVAELIIPNVVTGDGHSALMMGAYGIDGIWFVTPATGSARKYVKFADIETGIFTPVQLSDKAVDAVTGTYYYQTMYNSDNRWSFLTGQVGNASRNEADGLVTTYDGATGNINSFDVNIPQNAVTEGYYEPQGMFSRWNGKSYDTYVVYASGTPRTTLGVLHINASTLNAAPVTTQLGIKIGWREKLGTPTTTAVAVIPTFEFYRSIVSNGAIYIGSDTAGKSSDNRADPMRFSIRQSFGANTGRIQGEIIAGRNETAIRMVPSGDSIFEQQLAMTLRYSQAGVEKTSELTFSKTFGVCIGQDDRIPNSWVSGGRWGLFKNAGFQSNEKSVGFSSINSGVGTAVSFLSYTQNGTGLDLATTTQGNGLRLGGVTIPASPNDSTITNPKIWLFMDGNDVRPGVDNVVNCATAAIRWKQVYAGVGAISTSDGREKTAPVAIDDTVLDAWGKVQIIAFQWLQSLRDKGDNARWHFGVIAQNVRDTFLECGIDGTKYGLLCYDEWEATPEELGRDGKVVTHAVVAGNRWGIRADQCLFLEAAYQRRERARDRAQFEQFKQAVLLRLNALESQ